MAEYRVTFGRSARKELDKLDATLVERIFAKIEALTQEPRPPGCKKLKGGQSLWRIRIGDYRMVYSVDDRARLVDISAVRHRREVYRD